MRAALLLCAGCALPVVSAGTFLPAGDLHPGEMHASVSMEAGRVLAGPGDVHDLPATPPEARQYEVSTWFSSDLSLRWQASRRLALEAQLKLTNPVSPFTPEVVGGAVGARVRIFGGNGGGLSVEMAARAVGVGAQQSITRTQNNRTQVDKWNYRALGAEAPLVASYRVSPLFAVTFAPFLRAYFIRAWHDERQTALSANGAATVTTAQSVLQWQPVLTGGLGGSAAFDLGPVELAPGLALEVATKPGPGAATHVLFEPGISVGTRF